jgi:hypothetical protein
MTRSMFETLCEGKLSSSSSKAHPKRRSTTAARVGGGRGGSVADETITDGTRTAATTERGMRR